jgi:hypothetical protein
MVTVREETANPESKSVEVVVATENPVERYCEKRDLVVREILLMNGVAFRGAKKQLPIVDSHDRSTVKNVLGSVRNLRVEGSQLVGDAVFASDPASQEAYQKLLDGHLTDFSITATPKDVFAVKRGETYALQTGEIEGPADIVTNWIPSDASLVAAGADETSTVRELRRSYLFYGDDDMKVKRALSEEKKAELVAKGMPEQITDAEQALDWALGLLDSSAPAAPAGEAPVEPIMSEEPNDETLMLSDDMLEEEPIPPIMNSEDEKPAEEIVKKAVNRALKNEQIRRKEIRSMVVATNLEPAFADQLVESNVSLEIARQKVLEKIMTSKPIGASSGRERVEFGSSGEDKFRAAVTDGLIQRSLTGAGLRRGLGERKWAPGSEDFKNMGLLRIAEQVLRFQNVNVDRMPYRDIALAALGSPSVMRRYNIERAYHTSGMFGNILLDSVNKTLLEAYQETPATYESWVRTAPSVQDFKAINRIRFSEAPDLEVVPEARPYKQMPMTDSKETYRIEKYGGIFTVSWETVVNDDLDAISRIPAMHGNAAKRKINKVCYNILTSNPTMGDSYSLFSASHASGSNFANASAAPSVTTLNTAFTAMMKQKGLSSDAIINVTPRFLIVPVSQSATALQLVASLADPAVGGNVAGNSNTMNIYGPNGVRPLQIIVEPVLEAYSTTAWFLAADYNTVDTVEVSFLQGEESPVIENEWDFDTDVYKYKVRQTFAAAPIDWRGLYKYHNA